MNKPLHDLARPMLIIRRRPTRRRRGGMVLVLVLIVVAMLSLAGFTFTELMSTERKAAQLLGREAQSRAAMESGVELLKIRLDPRHVTETHSAETSGQSVWNDVVVFHDELRSTTGRFSAISPWNLSNEGGGVVRSGPTSDCGRLNLNVLLAWERRDPEVARRALLALPGMTDEVADSMLDWMDADNESRPFGAEADYYASLDPPYEPRNGPIASIDELLLVRGVTPTLLFGTPAGSSLAGDASSGQGRQGRFSGLDESNSPEGASPFHGWAPYLTLYSAERNVAGDGTPRIDLNDADLRRLHRRLSKRFSAKQTTFVVLFRQYGPGGSSDSSSADPPETADFSIPAAHRIGSVLDLVGASVAVPKGAATTTINSPFSSDPGRLAEYLPTLLDACTVTPAPVIRGRVDVMEAPAEVLSAVPGMSPVKVDAVLSGRARFAEKTGSPPKTLAWLVTGGAFELGDLKALLPYLTATGGVYRAEVAGYLDVPSAVVRCEVVVDATHSPPEVVLWRSLDPLSRTEAAARFDAPSLVRHGSVD